MNTESDKKRCPATGGSCAAENWLDRYGISSTGRRTGRGSGESAFSACQQTWQAPDSTWAAHDILGSLQSNRVAYWCVLEVFFLLSGMLFFVFAVTTIW